MMLAHVTTPVMGLVGAGAVGRLGEAHLLGAVALGAVIFDFIFWTFGALRMATGGLTAQAVGGGERDEIDALLARALMVAAAIGALLVVFQAPIGWAAVRLAGASEAVSSSLAVYFGIRIWAAPFTLGNYVVLGSVLGRGCTDLGLMLQVAINVTNIALTVLFVSVAGFGVAGAALASVLAEGAGLALGLVTLAAIGSHPFRVARGRIFGGGNLVRMLVVNRDVMIRTAALVVVYATFASEGARAGDVTLAANAILQNLWLTAGYVLDGFATAVGTLCGQSLGARSQADFRRSVRLALTWSVGLGLCLAGVFLAGGGLFIDAVTTNAEVRAEARRFLVFAAATPLASGIAFTLDGVFVGATWTAAMRNLMLASLAIYLALFWALKPLGNAGLWSAMLAFLAVRGLLQGLAYPGLVRRTFAEP